ncbi:MAG: HNH endonuclease signature motif containing protein [Candidatus Nitrosotenuis sp.]
MRQIVISILCTIFLILPIFLNASGQLGSRDLEAEYCINNWQRDPVRCAEYVPKDYEEKKSEYQAQELGKVKQETAQSKLTQESQRLCPLGSHLGKDSFGNQVCLDSKTNEFVSYPNTGQGNFGNSMIIGIVIVVIMIIVGGIAIARRKTAIGASVESLPRRGWTNAQHKEILRRQNGVCAMCGEYSGSYHFDHIDGNSYNNDLGNAQALCPNCHDRKTRGLN